MSLPSNLPYGTHQSFGRLAQQWMEGSTADNCPILPATLKFKDLLRSKNLEVDMEMHPYLPVQIEEHFAELEMMGPSGGAWDKVCIQEVDTQQDSNNPGIHMWEGQVAPGILIVEEIKRTNGPYTSEICQAVYKHYFPIETLKYVYTLDVCNGDTKDFVTRQLYSKSKGLSWPDETMREWESGTPEFEGLLGTQLGRTVACLVLGAFSRGTRRIARIRTYYAFEALQIRFELEDVVQNPGFHNQGLQYRPMQSYNPVRRIIRVAWNTNSGPQTRSATRRRMNADEQKRMALLHKTRGSTGIRKA